MRVYTYMKYLFSSVTDSERGASLVEYALLVSLIALVAFIAVAAFGGALSTEYSDIAGSMP
jgi:Flp pilus assembly pilin Flp